jgi:Cu/Zn superoxide dismutase
MSNSSTPGVPADSGSVTAEFAMVLPAVMALAMTLLALTSAVTARIDCQDAASAAAREMLTSGDAQRSEQVARVAGGNGTEVWIRREDTYIVVTTQCPILPDVLRALPLHVNGKAAGTLAAAAEPDASAEPVVSIGWPGNEEWTVSAADWPPADTEGEVET